LRVFPPKNGHYTAFLQSYNMCTQSDTEENHGIFQGPRDTTTELEDLRMLDANQMGQSTRLQLKTDWCV